MKVVVTIAGLDPRFGGPAQTVPALCAALSTAGVAVTLITLANTDDNESPCIGNGYEQVVIRTRSNRYVPLGWTSAFRDEIARSVSTDKPVVLYDVGLWLPSNHVVSKFACRNRIPLMVSPRGMLSSHALSVSKWKKRVAWELYQKNDLKSAQLFHATSAAEADDFRTRGLQQPIAIIPNGVEVPPSFPGSVSPLRCERGEGQGEVSSRWDLTSGSLSAVLNPYSPDARRPDPLPGAERERGPNSELRTVLFLSRLHPIKGLTDLVRAWARVRPAGWRVVIAGPNEGNHQSEIESLLKSLGVRGDFEFIGPVEADKKWNLYRNADLFVLPSYSESFGQVVAEALACGLPVITTRATPWRELEEHRCGWWIATGTDALAITLADATARTDAELRAMGERGRNMVAMKYSWRAVAEKMKSVFEWAVGTRPAPDWLS